MTKATTEQSTDAREIRVFLSSTFKDMGAERGYLLTHVFPKVRRRCAERQVAFTEIDLRWGITEEASKNGRTVEMCLDEIDRCRYFPPFFIGFLGERYGWVPRHDDLEAYWENHADSPYADQIRSALDAGISVTELEMRYAFLRTQGESPYARIFLRDRQLTEHLHQNEPDLDQATFYEGDDSQLASLKTDLRDSPCMAIDGYTRVEEFGAAVESFLLETLDQLFPAERVLNRFEIRNRAHAIYAESRTKAYVPIPELRQEALDAINAGLSGSDNASQYISITAHSGLGKSAFLADFKNVLPDKLDVWSLSHFTGADGDRTLAGWADRLLAALEDTGQLINDVPSEPESRWAALPVALLEVQRGLGRPMVLMLDAVNQLNPTDAADKLKNLKLPTGVVLLITSTPDIDTSGWAQLILQPLDADQRRTAIERFLGRYRKELGASLVSRLADDNAASVPLFLRLVLEELRLHARHETLETVLTDLLATGEAGALFTTVLAAMDADFSNSGRPGLASHAARLLSASRRGLMQTDLAKLLADSNDPVDPADNQPRLPDHLLSPILARLESFCGRDDGRLYIMHDALLRALLADGGPAAERRQLAAYFSSNGGQAVAERVHQCQQLENIEGVVQTLGRIPGLLALWQEETLFLRDALSDLGAGLSSMTDPLTQLTDLWAESLTALQVLPEELDVLTVWLIDNAFIGAAEAFGSRMLDQREQRNSDPKRIATSLNNLAGVYENQNRPSEAEPLFKQALAIKRQALPKDHLTIAATLNNLAQLYKSQNRLSEAEPLDEQALAICKQVLPEADEDIAKSLGNLAGLYKLQNRFEEAESLHERALAINRQALRDGHPDIARSLNNLAGVYKSQNRLAEAETLCRQALAIDRQALSEGHPSIAKHLNNLAELYKSQNRLAEAEPLYEQALAINRQALPDGDPSIATSLDNLAGLYQSQNRPAGAVPLSEQALAINRQALPEDHPTIATNLNNLANLYRYQNRLGEAEPLYEQALAICKQALPEGNPTIAKGLDNLAELYQSQNRLAEAEPLLEQALAINRKALPEGDPTIAKSLNNLAGVYRSRNRLAEAEPLYEQTLAICEQTLSEDHPAIATSLENLAGLYESQNRLSEAEPLYERALAIRQQAF